MTAEMESGGEKPIYQTLGFPEASVAKGLDPNQILEHLGDREDIIAKFLKDNKKFDRERAEMEVDKFIADREMVEKYIAWEVKKKDPSFQRQSREENFGDPKVIALYAVWLVGGAGIAYFKNVIAAPKFASGEWEPLHIKLPFSDTPAVVDSVSSILDVAHNAGLS